MSVFERYLHALDEHITEHGHRPRRVYVSPTTAMRLEREMSALRMRDVPPIGAMPPDVMGWAGGCEWHRDPAMGDGFRFEAGA